MRHLVAYRASIDSAALTAVTPIADPTVRIVSTNLYVPRLNRVVAVAPFGANLTLARLNAPSLLRRMLPDLHPFYRVANLTRDEQPLFLDASPVVLQEGEGLAFQAAEDAAGASAVNLLCWFGDGRDAQVSGEIITVRATGAATLTAGAWTAVSPTIGQTLALGDYDIVGMHYSGATALAARIVTPGGEWRNGVPGAVTEATQGFDRFRAGRSGVIASFYSETLFQVECLATAADTAQVFYFDLVQRRSGR